MQRCLSIPILISWYRYRANLDAGSRDIVKNVTVTVAIVVCMSRKLQQMRDVYMLRVQQDCVEKRRQRKSKPEQGRAALQQLNNSLQGADENSGISAAAEQVYNKVCAD